jgi:hypothetical protein
MNIAYSEVPLKVEAKTCGCKEKNMQKVTYSFTDTIIVFVLIKKTLYQLS